VLSIWNRPLRQPTTGITTGVGVGVGAGTGKDNKNGRSKTSNDTNTNSTNTNNTNSTSSNDRDPTHDYAMQLMYDMNRCGSIYLVFEYMDVSESSGCGLQVGGGEV